MDPPTNTPVAGDPGAAATATAPAGDPGADPPPATPDPPGDPGAAATATAQAGDPGAAATATAQAGATGGLVAPPGPAPRTPVSATGGADGMGMPHTGHPEPALPYGAAALLGLGSLLLGLALRRRMRPR
jgi:hypothetical protein